MMRMLLFLAPPETWMLLLMFASLCLVIGLRKIATTILGGILMMALFTPFLEALINILPTWMLILLMVFAVLSIFRLIVGRRVAAHFFALVLHDLFLLPFRFIGWLLRGPGR
ncbi:MAG: hypothetical protein AB2L22_12900 [Syntrophales bacterium]